MNTMEYPKEEMTAEACPSVSAQMATAAASNSTPAHASSSVLSYASCADTSEENDASSFEAFRDSERAEATGELTEEGAPTEDGDPPSSDEVTEDSYEDACDVPNADSYEEDTLPEDSYEDACDAPNADSYEEGTLPEGSYEAFAAQAEADMRELCALFPSLSPDGRAISLGELQNPRRFAELRAAGLTAEEAFLASNFRMLSVSATAPEDGRHSFSHMKSALPRASGGARSMPTSLLVRTRTLFEGLSDRELASLYRRVTE